MSRAVESHNGNEMIPRRIVGFEHACPKYPECLDFRFVNGMITKK